MNTADPTVPYGFCHCGCGERTNLATQTKAAKGHIQGKPVRFVAGHQHHCAGWLTAAREHRETWRSAGILYGECLCGCGQRTSLAPSTDSTRGYIRGEPRPYLPGHKRKPDRYRVEDRGYSTPCWIWQMWTGGNGYGYIKRRGSQLLAHRTAYEAANGPIPAGLVVHHCCEQPACVNPDHLEALTRAEHGKRHAKASPASSTA